MTDADITALRNEIRTGFQTLDQRLQALENGQHEGFADMQSAIHGIMFKLLTASEITEIRSKMKNPPNLKDFPFWAIR
jgi:hypothetical protein